MIKQFLDIVRRYFKPYKMYIVWSIVLNFVAQWLNVFSFVVLIPILNILFKIDQNVYTYKEWTWSTLNKDLIVNNAYAWVKELIANQIHLFQQNSEYKAVQVQIDVDPM